VRRAGEGRVVGGVKGVELIWITATEAVVVKVEVGGGGLVKAGAMGRAIVNIQSRAQVGDLAGKAG
jgi:hypothetical protein